jgi:hypothetical protein
MPLTPIEGQPGLFRDSDTGQVLNVRDFRESDKWDTVLVPAGVITAGTQFTFFQDIQGKRLVDTNIKTPRKLSAGESMVLDRIGLYFRLATGDVVTVPRDIKKIVENAYYRLKINDILQDEGPVVKFPSGYGLYGHATEHNAGIVSLGIPATASAAKLVKKQLLNQNHELDGLIEFPARQWLADAGLSYADPDIEQPVLVTNYLHGLVRSAVTK